MPAIEAKRQDGAPKWRHGRSAQVAADRRPISPRIGPRLTAPPDQITLIRPGDAPKTHSNANCDGAASVTSNINFHAQ